MKNNCKAFQKGLSSLFVITSPLNLLCAVNAIHEFEIVEFRFILLLHRDTNERNNQVFEMMSWFGYPYELYYRDQFSLNDYFSCTNIFSEAQEHLYDRIFMGNYHDVEMLALTTLFASPNSCLLFIDDGNATISALKNHIYDYSKPQGGMKLMKWYKNSYLPRQKHRRTIIENSYKKGYNCDFGFYTIYSDIKSRKYVTYPNTLQYVLSKGNSKNNPCIIIIGGAYASIANQLRISEYELINVMQTLFKTVRCENPDLHVLFIPHGRDNNEDIRTLCKSLDIEYRRINTALEFFMVSANISPIAIYGTMSTALLTLKKLFPNSHVVNWVLNKKSSPFYQNYKDTSNYFLKHGIEKSVFNIEEDNNTTLCTRINRILRRYF